MTSRRTAEFWQFYQALPERIQAVTRKAYQIFRENPAHPALRLERLKSDPRAWSVRYNAKISGCGLS